MKDYLQGKLDIYYKALNISEQLYNRASNVLNTIKDNDIIEVFPHSDGLALQFEYDAISKYIELNIYDYLSYVDIFIDEQNKDFSKNYDDIDKAIDVFNRYIDGKVNIDDLW